MKGKIKSALMTILPVLLFLPSSVLFAQWQSDVRLTNNDSLSRMSDNHARCITAGAGGLVHTVWWDKRDGNNEIYYKRSTNNGITWGSDTRLTNDPGYSISPSIAEFGTNIHVVWLDYRDNADGEIYYKRSTNSGVTWTSDIRLTTDTYRSEEPSLCVTGSYLHLVYRDSRDGFPNGEIYYVRSTDNGITWEPEVRLSFESSHNSQYPSVAVSGTTVHVIWDDWRDGLPEIYYARSTDNGTSWDPETRLTNTSSNCYLPCVAVTGSMVHVVWGDSRWFQDEIYYKRSTNAGATWSTDIRLTNDPFGSFRPSVAVSDSFIHVVFYDTRDGPPGACEVYYLVSTNRGVTWSQDTRLTNASGPSLYCFIAVSDTTLHLVWTDSRDLNQEIYYKRNPSGIPCPQITHYPSLLTFDYNYSAFAKAIPLNKNITKITKNKIDDRLETIIAESAPDEFIPILIMLSKQMNPDYLIAKTGTMSKPERRCFIINECKALASATQKEILTYLENQKDNVIDIFSLWSANAIFLKAKPEVIGQIAQRNDIWKIGYSEPLSIVDGTKTEEPRYRKVDFIPENGREICWGVAKINADDVWPLGQTGSGIIVGHMDSGVNYNHADLIDHMWDGSGAGYPNHGWDFSYNDNNPIDDNGHGTQTAGIVAGDGTSGSNTGVAPDAQIMALKIYPGTSGLMGQAVDFALEHGADILSTSIGVSNPPQFVKDFYRAVSNVAYAAGLVWCCAAGNGSDGAGGHYPVPQDINAPSCCPAPWYAPNGGNSSVIAIGATDTLDNVAIWSSYGPTAWNTTNYTDYPYPPGLMKPEVAAPGVNCKSLSYTNNTGYVSGINGTSFAQPHVAGAIALMLSRNPALTPQQIDSLLQTYAVDIAVAGRDSLSGAGRIDALAAVNEISDGAKWAQLWIINQSSATFPLEVSDITKTQNQSWLISTSPSEFTVPIGDSHEVWVSVDTTGKGLTWGQNYYDTLLVWSNDVTSNPDSVPIVLVMATVGVTESEDFIMPEKIQGLSVFPNPFSEKTDIQWQITDSENGEQDIALSIYDITGRCIKQFDNKGLQFGRATWDATDDFGNKLPAGIYFCQIKGAKNLVADKIILVK